MVPYLGEIALFAGIFAPRGWELCNGQALPIVGNEYLFGLLGVTYGGNGETTFGLPDLRGRTPIHMGQGNGLSNRPLGAMLGSETVALTSDQLPAHYHPVRATTVPGTQPSPTEGVWASASTNERQYTRNPPDVSMSPDCTTVTGESRPHENRMPFQAVTFIICIDGLHPPR